jgi:hypothetical protein
VHPHALQAVGRGLDHVDDGPRLAVARADDDVGPRLDVLEHCLGRGLTLGEQGGDRHAREPYPPPLPRRAGPVHGRRGLVLPATHERV